MAMSDALAGAGQGAIAGAPGGLPGALIGGGIGLLGGLLGANASSDAASQAAEAQRQALEFAKQQYAQGRTDLDPYMRAGAGAVAQMGQIAQEAQPGFGYQQKAFDFDKYKDPGAQYLMAEAVKAINASSLAKGGMGGGVVKAINTEIGNQANTAYQGAFGRHMAESQMLNDQAQQQYARNLGWQQNRFGQQGQIAGMGQGAAQGLAGMGQQLGQYGGNMLAGAGATLGSGTLNRAGSLVGGMNSFASQLAKGFGSMGSGESLPKQKYGQVDWKSVYDNSSDNLLGEI